MGLRKKPQEISTRPLVDERQVEQLIEKGGSVAVQEKKRAKTSNFPLRFMQDDMAERIEAVLLKRPLKPSMNLWINEAILDKLKAEE
jgi:hypothetical protein